jgi:uncharacterized membrane protein YoaK (UPF0700 family)
LDAIAFLHIGGTFVSNQTGTVLLLAMNVSGSETANTAAALSSLTCFVLGAAAAARYLPKRAGAEHWPRRTPVAVSAELLLVAACVTATSVSDLHPAYGVAPLAGAMGAQATLAKRIGLPSLTTGYITGSTTDMAMGSPAGDDSDRWWWYGAIPAAAIAAGAVVTALLSSRSVTGALALVGLAIAGAAWLTRPAATSGLATRRQNPPARALPTSSP